MMRRLSGVRLGGGLLVTMIIAGFSVLMIGCEEELVKTSPNGNIYKMRAEAVRVVRNGLKDENPMLRAKAVEVVADAELNEVMDEVVKLIRDEFVPVRFAAAVASGDMKYKPANKVLTEMLERAKDENDRMAAEYALYKIGEKKRIDILTEMVKSTKQAVRANAVYLLSKTEDKEYLTIVEWAQQDWNSDEKVKLAAMEARARLGDDAVLRRLWALLFSGYDDDRIFAAGALGLMGTRRARDVLFTKLDDDDLKVRIAVAGELGKWGEFEGMDEVVKVLRDDVAVAMNDEANERVKVLAALAIGSVCVEDLEEYLSELLRDESKIVRLAAAKAVLECGGK